jgi:hypothetical protein
VGRGVDLRTRIKSGSLSSSCNTQNWKISAKDDDKYVSDKQLERDAADPEPVPDSTPRQSEVLQIGTGVIFPGEATFVLSPSCPGSGRHRASYAILGYQW